MLDIQKEYYTSDKEKDEEWFHEVDHSTCTFKQKIHCWIKAAEFQRERQASVKKDPMILVVLKDQTAINPQNLVEAVNPVDGERLLKEKIKCQS